MSVGQKTIFKVQKNNIHKQQFPHTNASRPCWAHPGDLLRTGRVDRSEESLRRDGPQRTLAALTSFALEHQN